MATKQLRRLSWNDYNDYGTRKLAHYNEWLCDNSRKIGVPYSGFPEDDQFITERGVGMESVVVQDMVSDLTSKKQAPKDARPKGKKANATIKAPRKAKEGSKAEKAMFIFERVGGTKEGVIKAFMEELSMSTAGATTYFYNCKKASKA